MIIEDNNFIVSEVMRVTKINRKIVAYRKKANLSQEQLGKALKLSRATISAWEVGRANPPLKRLKLIAKVLKCNVADLV